MLYSNIFTTYLCMRELSSVRAWLIGVFRQRILVTYSPLIFIWFLSAQAVPNTDPTFFSGTCTVYLYMIFLCVSAHDCPTTRLFLKPRFIAVYLRLIFVCVGIDSRPLNKIFYSDIFITYLCMCTMPHAYTWLNRHLNQPFIVIYSPLISYHFCMQNCPNLPHYISLIYCLFKMTPAVRYEMGYYIFKQKIIYLIKSWKGAK